MRIVPGIPARMAANHSSRAAASRRSSPGRPTPRSQGRQRISSPPSAIASTPPGLRAAPRVASAACWSATWCTTPDAQTRSASGTLSGSATSARSPATARTSTPFATTARCAAQRAVVAKGVEVRAVAGDLADVALPESVPEADLVWASGVVHHVADQQAALATLGAALKPGGVLAIAEGGLEMRCLPWDLGVGRPGLERRLAAAREEWFAAMRAGIPGTIRMPYGWPVALRRAGLEDIETFAALIDHPLPGSALLRDYVVSHIGWLAKVAQ